MPFCVWLKSPELSSNDPCSITFNSSIPAASFPLSWLEAEKHVDPKYTPPNWYHVLNAWVLWVWFLCIYSNSAISGRGINPDLYEWTISLILLELRCVTCLCDVKLLYEPLESSHSKLVTLKLTTPLDADSHEANWNCLNGNYLKLEWLLDVSCCANTLCLMNWPKALFQWTKWLLLVNKQTLDNGCRGAVFL